MEDSSPDFPRYWNPAHPKGWRYEYRDGGDRRISIASYSEGDYHQAERRCDNWRSEARRMWGVLTGEGAEA